MSGSGVCPEGLGQAREGGRRGRAVGLRQVGQQRRNRRMHLDQLALAWHVLDSDRGEAEVSEGGRQHRCGHGAVPDMNRVGGVVGHPPLPVVGTPHTTILARTMPWDGRPRCSREHSTHPGGGQRWCRLDASSRDATQAVRILAGPHAEQGQAA
jgi:hypothetical protein